MKRKQLLFSWQNVALSDTKTVFYGCRFNEQYGKWNKGDFIECLIFKHTSHRLEEVGRDGKLVKWKKVRL